MNLETLEKKSQILSNRRVPCGTQRGGKSSPILECLGATQRSGKSTPILECPGATQRSGKSSPFLECHAATSRKWKYSPLMECHVAGHPCSPSYQKHTC